MDEATQLSIDDNSATLEGDLLEHDLADRCMCCDEKKQNKDISFIYSDEYGSPFGYVCTQCEDKGLEPTNETIEKYCFDLYSAMAIQVGHKNIAIEQLE